MDTRNAKIKKLVFVLMDFMYTYYNIKIKMKLCVNISFRHLFFFSIYLTANDISTKDFLKGQVGEVKFRMKKESRYFFRHITYYFQVYI